LLASPPLLENVAPCYLLSIHASQINEDVGKEFTKVHAPHHVLNALYIPNLNFYKLYWSSPRWICQWL
jgi:hypothetical protein